MGTFGGYETVHELYRHGLGWVARAKLLRGDADANAIIFPLGPFVVPRVPELLRNVWHRQPFFTRGGWNGVRTTRAALACPRTSTASAVPTAASAVSTYAIAMYRSTEGP